MLIITLIIFYYYLNQNFTINRYTTTYVILKLSVKMKILQKFDWYKLSQLFINIK